MAVASRPPPRSGPAKRTGSSATSGARATAGKKSSAKPPVRQPAKATRALAHGPAPRPGRGTVSKTSAQRFASRVRARRRRRRLIVVLALLVLGGGVWAALKSPWATVQRIEVTGTDRVSPATIRGEALPEVGHPMLLARTSDIAARVKAQRLIRSVTVERHWPGTLRVRVVEREPVAVLPVGSQLALVDDDGVVIQRVLASHAPAGLPRVEVSLAVAGNGVLRGCLDVLHGLPANLAGQVSSIGADSSDGIWLKLKDGARVEWGDSADTPHKAQVLTALLPQHGVNYDVRSPDTPAVRGK